MKPNKIIFSLFVLFLNCQFSFSQTDSGFVQFYVYPDEVSITIDAATLAKAKEKLKLPIGLHQFIIKGAKLETVNSSFMIIKDSTILVRKIMVYNNEYKSYLKLDKKNKSIRSASVYAGFVTTGACLVLSAYSFYQSSNSKELAQNDFDSYNKASNYNDIVKLKSSLETNRNNYYKFQNYGVAFAALSAVSAFSFYKIIKYTNKKYAKPVYSEPISSSFLVLPNNYSFCIKYKF